ncbi:MAG TPA: cell wall hydrolase [Rhizobiaceae bacterium]|nr:cell wall hydrolase [Rhizobiaceae bacterium]
MAGKSVPVAGALALFFAYPSIIGYQDAAALLAPGTVNAQDRWLANVVQKPGSSVLAAGMNGHETAELDPIVTGSVSAEPLSARIATSREPQRINRTAKGDRVVTSTYVQPPKGFNAGAVMERQSFLSPVAPKTSFNLAFAKPMPFGDAIKVASAFTRPAPKEPEVEKDLPVMVAKLVVESAPNVLAYGAEPEVVASPFAVVLKSDEPVNLIPRLDDKDHSWAAEPLPISVFSDREQHCLTAGIYFEARGEPVRGQAAVAQVILNRVKNPTYPNSICGVVYQNKDWRNRCQFSFACDKIKDKVQDPKRWRLASYVARETTHGRIWLAEVGSSTHYHATYVKPRWARAMEKVGRIGLHVFYRTFGGGWS